MTEDSSRKAAFASTLADLDSHTPAGMSDCESYGMTWGCDEDCPVLLRGECELQDADNKELYERAIAANAEE